MFCIAGCHTGELVKTLTASAAQALQLPVNDIAFTLPKGNIKGTFIWEPLNTWEQIFDKQGVGIDSLLNIYPAVAKKYDVK